jgi:hypothetical protein
MSEQDCEFSLRITANAAWHGEHDLTTNAQKAEKISVKV